MPTKIQLNQKSTLPQVPGMAPSPVYHYKYLIILGHLCKVYHIDKRHVPSFGGYTSYHYQLITFVLHDSENIKKS